MTASVMAPPTGDTGPGRVTTRYKYLYPGGPMTRVAVYDESGQLQRHVDTSYGAEGEPLSVTGDTQPVYYSYDALYRQVSVRDGNNNTTRSVFDSEGNLSRTLYPNSNGTYDAA